jgi:hypothetical protein
LTCRLIDRFTLGGNRVQFTIAFFESIAVVPYLQMIKKSDSRAHLFKLYTASFWFVLANRQTLLHARRTTLLSFHF